mgnify:FL=1
MPTIVTQGMSPNYQFATGSHDAVELGELDRKQVLQLLQQVSFLVTPEGDDQRPPAVIEENNIPLAVIGDGD